MACQKCVEEYQKSMMECQKYMEEYEKYVKECQKYMEEYEKYSKECQKCMEEYEKSVKKCQKYMEEYEKYAVLSCVCLSKKLYYAYLKGKQALRESNLPAIRFTMKKRLYKLVTLPILAEA